MLQTHRSSSASDRPHRVPSKSFPLRRARTAIGSGSEATTAGTSPVDEGEVEASGAQLGELSAGVPLEQRSAQPRVRVPDQGERRDEDTLARRKVEADAQLPVRRGPGLPGRRDGPVKLAGQWRGFPAERLARGREPHAVRGAGDEFHPDAALKLPQLQAQRRLRDAQPGGGPAEVQLLGEHEEGRDVSQLHRAIISVIRGDCCLATGG